MVVRGVMVVRWIQIRATAWQVGAVGSRLPKLLPAHPESQACTWRETTHRSSTWAWLLNGAVRASGDLTVYSRGRAAVSGLGEAAMDRALADADWLRARLTQVEDGTVWRTRDWATAALDRAELRVRWATTETGLQARLLERTVLDALASVALWNRAR